MHLYDMDLLDSLQTDITLVPPLERQDEFTVHVTVLRAPGTNWAETTSEHQDATGVMSNMTDDLADATWEDAEWR